MKNKTISALTLSAAAVAAMTVSSPAYAATTGGFQIAFQAPSSRLTEINPAGLVTTTASAMAPQTGVSLAALPDGSFDEGFQASDRTLWLANSVNGGSQVKQTACSPTPYTVTPGTSPSLAIDTKKVVELDFSEGGTETNLNIPMQNNFCSTSPGTSRPAPARRWPRSPGPAVSSRRGWPRTAWSGSTSRASPRTSPARASRPPRGRARRWRSTPPAWSGWRTTTPRTG
ncbi:hypothetical protein GCM10029964_004120 [Kibdelosporangium lantanae]